MPQKGIDSVTVPGCVAGWEALHRKFGKIDFSRLFSPAIYYGNNGFPVTEIISSSWQQAVDFLSSFPNARETFLLGGRAPGVGEVFKNRDLAMTLQKIAEQGRDGFYKGRTAESILQISKEYGGTFNHSDLTDFKPEEVEP